MSAVPLPGWVRDYRGADLRTDLIAGLVIWSVVTPQAVAYAQIAGLSPAAGLMAAPGAMLAYGLFGTSRQLIVGATTSTAAVSAAAVGALASGDPAKFAALSAMLALVAAVVFVVAGLLRLGAIADLIAASVMTGFLFGLGLTIAVGQVAALLGAPDPGGDVFPRLWHLIGSIDDADGLTLLIGVVSIGVLLAGRRLAERLPWSLIVLVVSVAVSAIFSLEDHGVATVGDLPNALPDPEIPRVGADDIINLIAPAFGVLILSAEAIGVSRAVAVRHGYRVDTSRDLIAMGGSNLLAGLSSGFVQTGGASQTAAADAAGTRTQLAGLVCAALVLLTGAFLAPLFEPLPKATLAAIVIVAVSGFFDVAAMRRYARIKPMSFAFGMVALVSVLVLGILQGLVVTVVGTLIYIVQRIARPSIHELGRDPVSGAWGAKDRHPEWQPVPDVLVIRSDLGLLYPNVGTFKDRLLDLIDASEPPPQLVVVDMSPTPELDVQSADTLRELADQLQQRSIRLRLGEVREPVRDVLERSGTADHLGIFHSMTEALADHRRDRA